MGIESREAQSLKEEESPVEAMFGNLRKREIELPYPKETVFRVFTGCLNNEADRLEYEALLTKSFQCQNILKNPGDLALLTLNGTFDKMGMYHVACRYAIIPERN